MTIRVHGRDLEEAGDLKDPISPEPEVARLLGDIFAGRGILSGPPTICTYRSDGAVRDALTQPLADGAGATTFGPVTIYRPGLGNTAPGPAFIARLARYTGSLIVAYANPGSKAEQQLRKLPPGGMIDCIKMPPDIAAKILIIGCPDNRMISWETASDVFLQQLEAISTSTCLSASDRTNANFTVFAHSQGGLDALTTKKRLIAAELLDVIGDIYTLNTPFNGSPLAGLELPVILAALSGLPALDAVAKLSPDYVNGPNKIQREDAVHISCAIAAIVDEGAVGAKDLRDVFTTLSGPIKLVGKDTNDGLVTRASQRFLGRPALDLPKSFDHAGIAEDWRVVDAAVLHKLGRPLSNLWDN